MEISKTAILDKTHYGLRIYSHVLRHYYPGEIASGDSLTPSENTNDRQQTVLSLSGRDCQPTKNPFNDDKPTLKIQIVNNCAEHYDLENSISKGDAFDFAALHYQLQGDELCQKLNEELYLRIRKQKGFYSENVIAPVAPQPFSRFIFYFMNIQPVWKNVFANSSDNGLDDYFDQLGNDFFGLYQTLMANPEIQFCLTAEQQEQFNAFFEQIQNTYLSLQGLDYMATIRRLGLIAFRIAMILSALRIMEHGDLPERIICEERDFQTTLEMVRVLVKHASKVFSELPQDATIPKRKNQKERYLDALPASFNRQEYLRIAASMSIPDKTAEGYITDFCKRGLIHREKQDHYLNPNAKETQDLREIKKG